MAMYYLARSTSNEVSGPFAEGRLVAMADAGDIDVGDQLAMHGTNDWLPADAVLYGIRMSIDEAKAMRSVRSSRRVRRRPMFVASMMMIALGLGLMFVFSGWLGVIVLATGVLIDQPRWTCGGCGNEVEQLSVRCPVCACVLSWE